MRKRATEPDYRPVNCQFYSLSVATRHDLTCPRVGDVDIDDVLPRVVVCTEHAREYAARAKGTIINMERDARWW